MNTVNPEVAGIVATGTVTVTVKDRPSLLSAFAMVAGDAHKRIGPSRPAWPTVTWFEEGAEFQVRTTPIFIGWDYTHGCGLITVELTCFAWTSGQFLADVRVPYCPRCYGQGGHYPVCKALQTGYEDQGDKRQ